MVSYFVSSVYAGLASARMTIPQWWSCTEVPSSTNMEFA